MIPTATTTSASPSRPGRRRLSRTLAGSAVLLALTTSLAACGGSGSGSTPSSSASAGAPAQDGQRGAQFQQVRACLAAAGISVPTPTAMPSGGPGGMPSGEPDGAGPGGAPPSGGPSGGPQGGPGGGIDFNDSKVRAALKACGIVVPTGRPTAQPSS